MMFRYASLILLLLFAPAAHADQLDGLSVLGIIIPGFIIAALSFLAMIVSALFRFSRTPSSPNTILNVSAIVFMLTIVFVLIGIGLSQVDSGFLLFCGILIAVGFFFLYMNNFHRTMDLHDLVLEPTIEADLNHLFEFQKDPEGVHMAAFTAPNPSDKMAYLTKWSKLIQAPNIVMFTYHLNDQIVGSVVHFEMMGETNVSYWIDRRHWNKGIATQGLKMFLGKTSKRPLHARTAVDNYGSQRVLEKCGFVKIRTEKAFANARQAEIEEFVYILR
ncbi:MAG: GNAT family N-acetyltransferase [Crocinitomicaceae bacterium]|jgi:RimJ/RimL family protein N-acetyltransferase|nr:GNAT family N-acetyltransferase [Crocinitomicaceae bacterium]